MGRECHNKRQQGASEKGLTMEQEKAKTLLDVRTDKDTQSLGLNDPPNRRLAFGLNQEAQAEEVQPTGKVNQKDRKSNK